MSDRELPIQRQFRETALAITAGPLLSTVATAASIWSFTNGWYDVAAITAVVALKGLEWSRRSYRNFHSVLRGEHHHEQHSLHNDNAPPHAHRHPGEIPVRPALASRIPSPSRRVDHE